MKIRSITLDDDGLPSQATVTMTITEAAAIAAVFGKLNWHAHRRLGMTDDDGPYDALVGGLINRYWDAGVDELVRPIELTELNKAPEQTGA